MFCLFLTNLFMPESDPDISASSGVLPVLQVLFGISAVKSGTRNEIWGLRGALMFRRLCLHSPGSLLPPVAPHLLAGSCHLHSRVPGSISKCMAGASSVWVQHCTYSKVV